jgi:hypothetical protein
MPFALGGDVVTAYPSVDESLERLHKAGCSVGEPVFGSGQGIILGELSGWQRALTRFHGSKRNPSVRTCPGLARPRLFFL